MSKLPLDIINIWSPGVAVSTIKSMMEPVSWKKYASLPMTFKSSTSFSEEKRVDRIVVASGNVIGYQLMCLNGETGEWDIIGGVDTVRGNKKVYMDQRDLRVPRFVHRVKCRTNKIRLQVLKAKNDGVVTTRTPPKDAKILNQRVEFFGQGRRRVRVDLYDIYKLGNAMIREIEAYSYVEKPKTEPD